MLRARSGTSSRSASASTSSGLGFDRPVSTKLRWRGRHAHLVREVHLAAPPLGAPLLHQVTDDRGWPSAEGNGARCSRGDYLTGHRNRAPRGRTMHGPVDDDGRPEGTAMTDTTRWWTSSPPSTPTSPATASPTPTAASSCCGGVGARRAPDRPAVRRHRPRRASPRSSTRCSSTTPTHTFRRTTVVDAHHDRTPATAGSSSRPTARWRSPAPTS